MEVISKPRRGGKTTEVVRLVRERNGILIVPSQSCRTDILGRFDLREDQVVTWYQATTGNWLKGVSWKRPIYIDNVDWVLKTMLWRSVEGVTTS